MGKEFQTDHELIEAIKENSPDAWVQLIHQFQGRLYNYACTRASQTSDAEDAVQETFISLLNTLTKHPDMVIENLETYLFTVLRNTIYGQYRTRWAKSVCLIQDIACSKNQEDEQDFVGQIASSDPSVTGVIRQQEQSEIQRSRLTKTLKEIISKSKKTTQFHHLKIMDLLFYSRLSNDKTARILNINENSIRVFKHRFLKRIRNHLQETYEIEKNSEAIHDDLLSEIWEENHLTCPKYSTLGNFLIENLDPDWFDYIDFHLTTFGCHFCRASFKDLQQQQSSEKQTVFQERLIASTIGFFTKTND
jgi:RNA polymerase sigma factor (sigma-70 family)